VKNSLAALYGEASGSSTPDGRAKATA